MTSPRMFVVDRLHFRVRIGVLLVWLGSWLLLLALGLGISALVFGEQPAIFWLVWGLATLWLSQYPSRWAEARLAVMWPSDRKLTLTDAAVVLSQKDETITLDRAQPIARQLWCFKIQRQRGSRVPAGHFCLGSRWTQGTAEIVMYAFASAAESATLRADNGFYELRSSRERAKAGPEGGRGREESLLAAEAARYERGGEVSFADFETLVQALATPASN